MIRLWHSTDVAGDKVARLPRDELGERYVGAGEGACFVGLGQFHDAGDAPRTGHRQRQDRLVAAVAIGRRRRRRHQVRRVEIGDDHWLPVRSTSSATQSS